MSYSKQFYDSVRESLFGGNLTQTQVNSLDAIYDGWQQVGYFDKDLLFYGLATAYHEVGSDLVPKEENLSYTAARILKVWPSRFVNLAEAKPYEKNPEKLGNKVYGDRLGNTNPGDGYLFRGRGFPQITGRENYQKFSDLLGIDLVGNPNLALRPDIAARILFLGIKNGLFTGKKLSDFGSDFVKARATVNADTATNGKKIAGYAEKFKAAYLLAPPVTTSDPKPKPPVTPPPITIPVIKPSGGIIEFIINLIKSIFGRK